MSGPVPDPRLYAANEAAAAFFRRGLLGASGSGPRAYLRDRGFAALLSHDCRWTVGHAPGGWTNLRDHLRGSGFGADELMAAGLVLRTRQGGLIDRFRDRITFGIRDREGRLCGFTARKSPGAPSEAPKYINSPTTQIYAKSELLFGLGEAVTPLESVIVTEGPLDAIAVDLSLTTSTAQPSGVALCGCALTGDHASQLRATGIARAVLALDPDGPGRRALLPASRWLMSRGLDTSMATGAHDPADLLRYGGQAEVATVAATARPAAAVLVDQLVDAWPTRGMGAESDLCCLRSVLRQLVTLPGIDPAALATNLATRIPLGLETVSFELAGCWQRRASHGQRDHGSARRVDLDATLHELEPSSPSLRGIACSSPTL
ncbi:hypothetical protein GCM10027596_31750 [Nocardioides korecus]